MTTCTAEIFRCSCGTIMVNSFVGLFCNECRIGLSGLKKEFFTICDGEVEKIWLDGKEVDCVCRKCGKSYGMGYIAREKFLESFCTV